MVELQNSKRCIICVLFSYETPKNFKGDNYPALFDRKIQKILQMILFCIKKIDHLLEISQFWYQSGMGWIIDVMAAEIDKEGKLMNNKFRVNPSHLWRDFRHIFWSSSSGGSSRKSSNSKSAVTSHAFKVSYPIFYSTCESCYVAIMAVVTPVVLIYAWKDWTFQVGCSSDATIPGTFVTVVVQIIAIVIFFTSWNSL